MYLKGSQFERKSLTKFWADALLLFVEGQEQIRALGVGHSLDDFEEFLDRPEPCLLNELGDLGAQEDLDRAQDGLQILDQDLVVTFGEERGQ